MKLTLTLLIISLMHLSATTYAQHAKLSVSVKNESLEKIFKDIEEQSEFLFFYNAKDIDKNEKISLNKENSSIEEILKDIAAKTGIVYTIKDRHIVLTNHPEYLKAIADQSSKKQITGVVVDNTGESVVGANVVEKGTTNGVVTDIDGKFTLNVEDNAVLEITYIGYNPQEVPVKNRSSLTITLTENLQALEEVVVIGYGIQKKVNLTGSVATISSKEISSIPVSSISNAMAGRMPGVFSFNSSGLPGSSSPITIRGVNTPNSTSPTYVIDGVVRDKADFDALDPNEIESFSVLKDAASAAVYGSRAANGVIMVTTKRGADQKPMFRYTAILGTERETRRPEIMNAYNRTQYLNNKFAYNGVDPSSTNYYAPDEVEWYKTHDYDRLEMAWQNPVIHQHNLSVNGGSDKIRYFLSAGYYDQKGVFEKVKYTKYY